MAKQMDRREFLELAALGSAGVVFAAALPGAAEAPAGDFYFLQFSDTHWGFEGPPNPDAKGTLPKAIRAVNRLQRRPDFVVFTGDLTHTTDDPRERRRRMTEFKELVSELDVETLRFMPGEHDAALDGGAAFRELFGAAHYSFDHKGLGFRGVDADVARARYSLDEYPVADER
jgi:metallophosphoesterase superfamily enzyme